MKLEYEAAKDAFEKVFAGDALFGCIFGSILEERFGEDSDLDVAVWMRDGVTDDRVRELERQLSDEIERDIDLINLRTCDPIIAMQVIQNGRLAFARERDDYHQFVARKISEYIDFKHSRQPAEDQLVDHRIVGTNVNGSNVNGTKIVGTKS